MAYLQGANKREAAIRKDPIARLEVDQWYDPDRVPGTPGFWAPMALAQVARLNSQPKHREELIYQLKDARWRISWPQIEQADRAIARIAEW